MGIFLVFVLFLLVIPLLVVGSTLLRLIFGVKAAFKPNSDGYFRRETSSEAGAASSAADGEGSIGHSQLGRKRLNVLKNRATDVQFDLVEENS